jgi:hypothetical protein
MKRINKTALYGVKIYRVNPRYETDDSMCITICNGPLYTGKATPNAHAGGFMLRLNRKEVAGMFRSIRAIERGNA